MRLLLFLLGAGLYAQTPEIAGLFFGTLQVGATQLRLSLQVIRDAEGKVKATVDSLDQGVKNIPVREWSQEGKQIRFGGFAMFDGTVNDAGTEITGTFQQNGMSLPLVLRKVDQIPQARRPQMPQPPFPYESEDVTVTTSVSLAGTLTKPKGEGPFPAVILLTGSGPQDRDETLFDHKPFLLLADRLTRAGFAVLRMDDRGTGKSTGVLATSSFDDLAADAVGMFDFLAARKEVDGKRIGFLGHSEGGAIAPLAAGQRPATAFVILLAGPGVAGDELMVEQGQALVAAVNAPADVRVLQRNLQKTLFAAVKTESDPQLLRARVNEAVNTIISGLPPEQQTPQARKQLQAQALGLLQAPLLSFIRYDPAKVLPQLRCPVLALNGTLDLQVVAKQNLAGMAALVPDLTAVSLPGLNHLFQTAKTGMIAEYQQIEETMAPVVLELITDWLQKRIVKR